MSYGLFFTLCLPQPIVCVVVLYLGITFLLSYVPKSSKPNLVHADTIFNKFVVDRLKTLKAGFNPSFLLRNGHLQSIMSNMGKSDDLKFERKYIDLNDKGTIAFDVLMNNSDHLSEESTVIILLPGLIGEKHCLRGMCRLASKQNYRVVVFNKRGHCQSNLATPILQTFGDARDFRQCVEYIHNIYPVAKLVGVGYSGGAGLLQSYLGSYPGDTFISCAVLTSSGFNVAHLSLVNMPRLYERMLVAWLKKHIVKGNEDVLQEVVDLPAVYRSTSLRTFEYHLYCKMHGYRDVAEMWTDVNPMKNVDVVDVPVLCISGMDDPICVSENIPYELFKRDNWMLITTENGGHCGFFEGWGQDSWADKVGLEYINAVLEGKEHVNIKYNNVKCTDTSPKLNFSSAQ